MKKTVLSLTLAVASISAAFAASNTPAAQSVGVTVSDRIEVVVTASPITQTWGESAANPNVSAAAGAIGATYGANTFQSGQIQVSSNRDFNVTIGIEGDPMHPEYFAYQNNGFVSSAGNEGHSIPLSELKLIMNGTGENGIMPTVGTPTPISPNQYVGYGFRGGAAGIHSSNANPSYIFAPGFRYDGGTYSATITFTATQK